MPSNKEEKPLLSVAKITASPTVGVTFLVNLTPLLVLFAVFATLNKEKVKTAGGPSRLVPSAGFGGVKKGLKLLGLEAWKFLVSKPIENLTGFGSDSSSQRNHRPGKEDPVDGYYNPLQPPSTSPKNPTGVAFTPTPPVEATI
jgi:hypothetical protein